MAKRTMWFGIGAALGASAGVWAKQKFDRKVASSTPLQVGLEAVAGTRNLAKAARHALVAGNAEAQATAERLKDEMLRRNPAIQDQDGSRSSR